MMHIAVGVFLGLVFYNAWIKGWEEWKEDWAQNRKWRKFLRETARQDQQPKSSRWLIGYGILVYGVFAAIYFFHG